MVSLVYRSWGVDGWGSGRVDIVIMIFMICPLKYPKTSRGENSDTTYISMGPFFLLLHNHHKVHNYPFRYPAKRIW